MGPTADLSGSRPVAELQTGNEEFYHHCNSSARHGSFPPSFIKALL